MPKLPVVKPKELMKALQKMGFEIVRSSGSHFQLKRQDKLVTVPFHNRDLKIKTLKSILQQADVVADLLTKYL